jgi:hypothetical protein
LNSRPLTAKKPNGDNRKISIYLSINKYFFVRLCRLKTN